ncbi:alpha/beta hydrolase [Sesbania bispinosa]|nr:alpha/beta hydrolase [Sesbania bispinosa]
MCSQISHESLALHAANIPSHHGRSLAYSASLTMHNFPPTRSLPLSPINHLSTSSPPSFSLRPSATGNVAWFVKLRCRRKCCPVHLSSSPPEMLPASLVTGG